MKAIQSILTITLLILLIQSCESPYIPDTRESEQQYVVEGFIEAGDDALPTYVIVTRSIPYVSKVDLNRFEELFVDNAVVSVNDGSKEIQLFKLCINDPNLPLEVKEAIRDFFGLNASVDSLPNICIYIDIFEGIRPKEGGKYDLKVQIDTTLITATTTIPTFVGLNKYRWDDPPGEPTDTLAQLWATINDPMGKNYFRYMTEENNRGLIAPFTSVTDDSFFDGKQFEFPLSKAEYNEDKKDINNFGLYNRGDSISIKWMCLDKAHFDFWNTRDFAANSGGPFSSYVRIAGNVKGALGVWGGYSSNVDRLFCPPK